MFFEPIYIPRAFNTGTCPLQGDLFYSAGLHWNQLLATVNTEKIRGGFGKKNAGKWTGRVETSKKKIPGSKLSMYGYKLTYSRLNAGEWTGRVEISKEEIPGRKRSMYGYILTYSWL